MMKKLKEWAALAVAGVGVAIAAVITIAISVTLVPLISLLIGYWIGFVADWLAGDWLLLDNLPELSATTFFAVSAVAMLVKNVVKENKQK